MSEPPSESPPEVVPLDYAVVTRPPRRGLAIAALVLGILACVFVWWRVATGFGLGLAGLILGIIALTRISLEPQRYGGKGMAIGGIISSIFGLLIAPILFLAFILPFLDRTSELAKRAVDASNLRAVGRATRIYAYDNGGTYPSDLPMLVAQGTLAPEQLINPSSGNVIPACDYYYVVGPWNDEASTDWIVAYSDPVYHNGAGANILYIDGRVEFLKEPTFSTELKCFMEEYEKACGEPPVVIGPK
ncbi:MAG: DUF4190 domain-containing protein [Planctomycetota bacterium]